MDKRYIQNLNMVGIYMSSLSANDRLKLDVPLKTELIFPVLVRYGILLFFYVSIFAFFFNDTLQFILFIGIFILNFFFLVFLYKDFLSNAKLSQTLFSSSMAFNFGMIDGALIKFFVYIIFLVLLMQIASIAIILVVFDYGKSDKNNYISYTMTPPNMIILKLFKELIMWTTLCIGIFAFIILYTFTENRMKALFVNIIGIIISIIVLVCGSYGIYVSTKFLDIKGQGRQLYQ